MPKEWGLVALSCSIMVLAGSIVAAGFLGSGFNVGPVGQWASAIATILAVWVAVSNTQRTLDATAAREEEKQMRADHSFVGALATLTGGIFDSIYVLHDKVQGTQLTPAQARRYANAVHLEGLTASIDRLPLHQSPDEFYVDRTDSIRTAAFNVHKILESIAAEDEGEKFDIEKEYELIRSAYIKVLTYGVESGHLDNSWLEKLP